MFEESHEFHYLSLLIMQEVFPGPCESCDGMVVWDHLFMTAKCFCVDREVLVEWYNLAKWLFCQPWESSCPGINASSAEGWWHKGHLPVQLWVS